MDTILDHPQCGLSREDQLRLKDLAPRLDVLGFFPEEALEIIVRNNHFHLFVPSKRGGLDFSLVHGMRVIEAYARIEGNLGWIVQIGAGGGVFSAYLRPEASDHFLGQSNQVIAGSGFVGGLAHPENGGFRVSGDWKYASGSLHATAFTGNCRIMDGPFKDQVRAVIVPSEEVRIIQNWNAMGMRATDSHSFRMDGVWVPESQTFVVSHDQLLVRSRVLNLPFTLYARALFMPVLTGIGFDYMTLTRQYLRHRNNPDDTLFVKSWNHLNRVLRKSRNVLFHFANKVWTNTPSINQHHEKDLEFGRLCVRLTTDLMLAIDRVHRHTGMKGIRMDEVINVAYRNFKTAAAHQLLRH